MKYSFSTAIACLASSAIAAPVPRRSDLAKRDDSDAFFGGGYHMGRFGGYGEYGHRGFGGGGWGYQQEQDQDASDLVKRDDSDAFFGGGYGHGGFGMGGYGRRYGMGGFGGIGGFGGGGWGYQQETDSHDPFLSAEQTKK
jgi:hypothetical protein